MVWFSTVTMVWAEQSENCSLIIWQTQALFSSKLHVVHLCCSFPIQQVPGALFRGQSRWVLKMTTHFHLTSILMMWCVNSLCTRTTLPIVQHNCGILSTPCGGISGCGFLDFFQYQLLATVCLTFKQTMKHKASVMKHKVESCYKLLSTKAGYNHNISHALFLIMMVQKKHGL